MAVQLGLSAPTHQALGIRRAPDRRIVDRRESDRPIPDRRHRQRRRARFRSVLFTALTFVVPHQVKHGPRNAPWPSSVQSRLSDPRISVSIDSFTAVPANRAYDALINEAAAQHRVDRALIRSVMEAESAFDPTAISRAGALGLMQLMPEVAAEYDVRDPFNPRQNIMAGARYLRRLLDQYHGNVALTLASYNAGAGAVARYGTVPPFPETQKYVKRVLDLLAGARGET